MLGRMSAAPRGPRMNLGSSMGYGAPATPTSSFTPSPASSAVASAPPSTPDLSGIHPDLHPLVKGLMGVNGRMMGQPQPEDGSQLMKPPYIIAGQDPFTGRLQSPMMQSPLQEGSYGDTGGQFIPPQDTGPPMMSPGLAGPLMGLLGLAGR